MGDGVQMFFTAVWEICIRSAQRRWMIMSAACTTIQMNLTCVAKSSKHSSKSVPWNETKHCVVENNNSPFGLSQCACFLKNHWSFLFVQQCWNITIDNVFPLKFSAALHASRTN